MTTLFSLLKLRNIGNTSISHCIKRFGIGKILKNKRKKEYQYSLNYKNKPCKSK